MDSTNNLVNSKMSNSLWLRFWVLFFLGVVFILSYSGRIISPDEEIFFRSSEQFFATRDLTLVPPSTIPQGHYQLLGNDGKIYPVYGPALIAIHLPFVALGHLLPETWANRLRNIKDYPFAEKPFDQVGPRLGFALSGIVFSLLVALFSFSLASALKLSPKQSVFGVLMVVLATPILAYSKTTFRDIPQTAFVLGGLTQALMAIRRKSWQKAGLAGALLGLGFLAKDQTILNFLLVLPWFLTRIGWFATFWSVLGFLGAALPLFAFKMIVQGTLARAAGGVLFPQLSTLFSVGAGGLLFSPGKGLFIFAPWLIWGVFGLRRFFQSNREEGIFVGLQLLSMFLPPCIWWWWHGGLSWGPRLLIQIIPWLGLLATREVAFHKGIGGKVIFLCFVIIGIVVNLSGLALDWHLFYVVEEIRLVRLKGATQDDFGMEMAWNLDSNIILASMKNLGLIPRGNPPPEFRGTSLEKVWWLLFFSKEQVFLKGLKKIYDPHKD